MGFRVTRVVELHSICFDLEGDRVPPEYGSTQLEALASAPQVSFSEPLVVLNPGHSGSEDVENQQQQPTESCKEKKNNRTDLQYHWYSSTTAR